MQPLGEEAGSAGRAPDGRSAFPERPDGGAPDGVGLPVSALPSVPVRAFCGRSVLPERSDGCAIRAAAG
eukprot:10402928-Lingulodinium_polyedra.AAC.1